MLTVKQNFVNLLNGKILCKRRAVVNLNYKITATSVWSDLNKWKNGGVFSTDTIFRIHCAKHRAQKCDLRYLKDMIIMIRSFVNRLFENDKILVSFTVEFNFFGVVIESFMMNEIIDAIENTPPTKVTGLAFDRCSIEPCVFLSLNNYLISPQCTIQTLKFGQMSISHLSFDMLPDTFRANESIRKLTLRVPVHVHDGIDDGILSEIVLTSRSLTQLHVITNGLLVNFGLKLAKSIEFDTKMTKLTLLPLRIDVMAVFLKALAVNVSLKEVTTCVMPFVSNTETTSLLEISYLVADILDKNNTLDVLNMEDTIFSDKEMGVFSFIFNSPENRGKLVFYTMKKEFKARGVVDPITLEMMPTAVKNKYRFKMKPKKPQIRKDARSINKNDNKKTIKTKKKYEKSNLPNLNILYQNNINNNDDDCINDLSKIGMIENDVNIIISNDYDDNNKPYNISILDCLDVFTNVQSINIK